MNLTTGFSKCPSARQRHRLVCTEAIGPRLHGLVVDHPTRIHVGHRLMGQPVPLFLRAIQDESACFMIQPRERSRRSAN